MKKSVILKRCLGLLAFASLTMVSCDENDVDVFGSADLKVINLAPNSGSQKFVLANIPEIGNLDYLEGSVGYLDVASGNNLVAQFRDEDDNDLYGDGNFDLDDNRDYTIYLTGLSRDDAEARLFQDDLNAPSAGKAKIKFLHLSVGAPSSVGFSTESGTVLSEGLSRYSSSSYTEIDAGTLSIDVKAPGSTETIATLPSTAFAAGKIYTICIADAAAGGYVVRKVDHN